MSSRPFTVTVTAFSVGHLHITYIQLSGSLASCWTMHLSDQCSSSLSYSSSKLLSRTNCYFGSGPIKASFSFTTENISFNKMNISSTQSHTGPVDTKFWQFVHFRTLLHWITGAQPYRFLFRRNQRHRLPGRQCEPVNELDALLIGGRLHT